MAEAPLTLAIDTSIAINVGIASGEEVWMRVMNPSSRAHVEELMPAITEACERAKVTIADFDRIVVGLGPGPFTGLRVGIVTAQTLAAVTGVPLLGRCTLDVLAVQTVDMAAFAERAVAEGIETDMVPVDLSAGFVVASDARRRELYWARYAADGSRLGDPQVSAPTGLPDLPVVGPGTLLYPDVLGDRILRRFADSLDIGKLAAIGADLPDAGSEPLYLRRPDATVSTKRKSTLVTPVRRRRQR